MIAAVTSSADEEFDCSAGVGKWQTGWSAAKKDFCCKKGGGVDTCQFDCEAGLSMWETGWSEEKKDWCCTNSDKAFCEGSKSIVVDEDTGCDNWKSGSFGPSTLQDSPEKCMDRCRITPGCTTTNYQKVECPHKPGEQVEKGSCYVMGGGGCRKGRNECWDVYVLPEHERKPMGDGFAHDEGSRPHTWCSNLDDISTAAPLVEWSVWSCKLKCQLDKDCTAILYQSGDCDGVTSEGSKSCHLLKGACKESHGDSCWDLHYKNKDDAPSTSSTSRKVDDAPSTSSASSSSADSQKVEVATSSITTTPRRARPSPAQTKGTLAEDMDAEVLNLITVEDWKSLRVGDRLKICAKTADKIEFSTIHAVGPEEGQWILDEKLALPHQKGTHVVLQDGDCPELEMTTTEEELPSTVTETTTTHNALFSLTQPVSAGKFDIMVDRQDCFEIGDTISFVRKPDVRYQIVDKGSLRLDKALVESYAAGASVMRISAGGNPAFCGPFEDAR